VTITALAEESLPSAPAPASYSFAGIAYNLEPDGATFSPAISLSFTYPNEAKWGEEYQVKTFDSQSGTWLDLPTTTDPSTGRITAQVSHFCCIALFAKSMAPPATRAVTFPNTQVTLKAPSSPAPTAIGNFIGMMTWVTELVLNNVYILVIVVVLGIAYFVKMRKYPGSGL
jgi:hypothetical protein